MNGAEAVDLSDEVREIMKKFDIEEGYLLEKKNLNLIGDTIAIRETEVEKRIDNPNNRSLYPNGNVYDIYDNFITAQLKSTSGDENKFYGYGRIKSVEELADFIKALIIELKKLN